MGCPNNDQVKKLALSALHVEGRKPRQAPGTDLAQNQSLITSRGACGTPAATLGGPILITSWGARGKPTATLGGPIRKGVK